MPTFRYRAVTAQGEVQQGELSADSESDVAERLSSSGLIPLDIEPGRSGVRPARAPVRLFGRRDRIGRKEIAAFTQELAAMLQAGLPLDRSLDVLAEIAETPALQELVGNIHQGIRGGASLADALEESGHFSSFYVNMIRAGEAGGSIGSAMSRLSTHLEQADALRQSVVSALVYPAILLGVAVLSIVILLAYVVPQFEQLFADMGRALPWPTQIVMATGDFFRSYWWLVIVLIALLVWAIAGALKNPRYRQSIDARVLRWPLVGELIAKMETARFARTLGTLLENGVPMLTGLGIVTGTLSNYVLAQTVSDAADGLRRGGSLTDGIGQSEAFPRLALHMIKVGEETGQIEDMLMRVGDIYDQEVQATVKRMLSLLEPVLILGMGVLIAGIIMSILVAILSVNQLAV